jgi:hypothetical protein
VTGNLPAQPVRENITELLRVGPTRFSAVRYAWIGRASLKIGVPVGIMPWREPGSFGPDAYAGEFYVVQDRRGGAQAHLLVRMPDPGAAPARAGWEAHQVGLEELVLAYLRAPAPAGSSLVLHAEPTEATR